MSFRHACSTQCTNEGKGFPLVERGIDPNHGLVFTSSERKCPQRVGFLLSLLVCFYSGYPSWPPASIATGALCTTGAHVPGLLSSLSKVLCASLYGFSGQSDIVTHCHPFATSGRVFGPRTMRESILVTGPSLRDSEENCVNSSSKAIWASSRAN